MNKIRMVDLQAQHHRLKKEIDEALTRAIEAAQFIQGPEVKEFSNHLSEFHGGTQVITCGNGTDALQICMMALGLERGDEIIIPSFTYAATAEVVSLLNLTPVLVDVDTRTFNINVEQVTSLISPRTKVIVPVHLFGQCANMNDLLSIASHRGLHIVEDAAQALGAQYRLSNGTTHYAATMGSFGITSFFPTKTLGCFGDGGAIFTSDGTQAEIARMIANHGQRVKYEHEIVGVNSRLDTIQAAILDVKLRHINDFNLRRQRTAGLYDHLLGSIADVTIPYRDPNSTHVFHQYTIKAANRDQLKSHLSKKDIPSMVYYPLPLHFQNAYAKYSGGVGSYPVSESLAKSVISLPMHTEMNDDQVQFICGEIRKFYNG